MEISEISIYTLIILLSRSGAYAYRIFQAKFTFCSSFQADGLRLSLNLSGLYEINHRKFILFSLLHYGPIIKLVYLDPTTLELKMFHRD